MHAQEEESGTEDELDGVAFSKMIDSDLIPPRMKLFKDMLESSRYNIAKRLVKVVDAQEAASKRRKTDRASMAARFGHRHA